MATRTTVKTIYTDDFTGKATEDVATVLFGFKGVDYEIDLNTENYETLEVRLRGFIDRARKVSKKGKGTSSPRRANRGEAAEIRAWAKGKFPAISERGRLAAEVIEAYHARKAS